MDATGRGGGDGTGPGEDCLAGLCGIGILPEAAGWLCIVDILLRRWIDGEVCIGIVAVNPPVFSFLWYGGIGIEAMQPEEIFDVLGGMGTDALIEPVCSDGLSGGLDTGAWEGAEPCLCGISGEREGGVFCCAVLVWACAPFSWDGVETVPTDTF